MIWFVKTVIIFIFNEFIVWFCFLKLRKWALTDWEDKGFESCWLKELWVNRTGKHVDDRIGLGNQWSYAIVSGLSGDHWPFLFLVEPISQLFTDCYSIMINVYFISDNGTLMNRHRNMRDDYTESSVLYIISDPLSKIKLLSFK